ncbi:unnamed protein product, partial [Iphiclides podalirius]
MALAPHNPGEKRGDSEPTAGVWIDSGRSQRGPTSPLGVACDSRPTEKTAPRQPSNGAATPPLDRPHHTSAAPLCDASAAPPIQAAEIRTKQSERAIRAAARPPYNFPRTDH